MKVAVIDHGLRREGGHPFQMAVGLRAELRRRGLGVAYYVNQRASPELTRQIEARAIFPRAPFERVSRDLDRDSARELESLGEAFATGCRELTAEGLTSDDLVLIPWAFHNELHGCARWLAPLPEVQRPRLVLNVMMEDPYRSQLTRRGDVLERIYRSASEELLEAAGRDRVLLTAHVDEMAKWLRIFTGCPVRVLPVPAWLPPVSEPVADDAGRTERISIAYLGVTFGGKGHELLPDVFEGLSAARDRFGAFVQIQPMTKPGKLEVEEALRVVFGPSVRERWRHFMGSELARSAVTFHFGELDSDEYHRRLAQTDIVLQPYNARDYRYKTSGVFTEAVAAGKVVVVPRETWMGQQVIRGAAAGVPFTDHTAPPIALALDAAIEGFEHLRDRARDLAPSWRARSGIIPYLDGVMDWVAP